MIKATLDNKTTGRGYSKYFADSAELNRWLNWVLDGELSPGSCCPMELPERICGCRIVITVVGQEEKEEKYWVNTDLNSPWRPLEGCPYPQCAVSYPEQYRSVSRELWEALRAAWDTVNTLSNRVDVEHPQKRK